MKRIAIRIEGTKPLLVHKFTDAAAMDSTSGARKSTSGDRGTPMEEAEKCLYKSAEDEKTLVIPQPNLFRCILDAGTFFKSGKSKVTTQKSSMIPSCLSLDQVEYPIEHKEAWSVDTRSVCIPSTGGRILRHRPKFNDWALSFEAELDTDIIGIRLFREIVDAAGKRIGLGDFRPARKGPFGVFCVTSWTELE